MEMKRGRIVAEQTSTRNMIEKMDANGVYIVYLNIYIYIYIFMHTYPYIPLRPVTVTFHFSRLLTHHFPREACVAETL